MIRAHNSLTVAHAHSPRSFAALMDVYEHNYILIRRLLPHLNQIQQLVTLIGRGGGLRLYVEITEQDRFTTVLRMFYRLEDKEARINEVPDIHVRIYHDARVAEAVSGRLRGRDCVPTGRVGTRCLDVRWRLNRFLYKWLRYLLHRQYVLTSS